MKICLSIFCLQHAGRKVDKGKKNVVARSFAAAVGNPYYCNVESREDARRHEHIRNIYHGR